MPVAHGDVREPDLVREKADRDSLFAVEEFAELAVTNDSVAVDDGGKLAAALILCGGSAIFGGGRAVAGWGAAVAFERLGQLHRTYQGAAAAVEVAHRLSRGIETAVAEAADAHLNGIHDLDNAAVSVADLEHRILRCAALDDEERDIKAHYRGAADVGQIVVNAALGGFFADEHMADVGTEKNVLKGIVIDMLKRCGDRVAGAVEPLGYVAGAFVRRGAQRQQHATALLIEPHVLNDEKLLYLFEV